jgi:hypothetical protein
MVRCEDWLRLLKRYLKSKGFPLNRVSLTHSRKADQRNKKSPRGFCHVVIGRPTIHCAEALETLPDEFIVGILLHELAHMLVKESDDPELDVDEFVLENCPESGYHYADVKYAAPQWRVAKNLECVSKAFLKELELI